MASNLFQRFFSIFSSKVITLLFGALTTPLLVRFLGSSLYGDYAFILSLLGLTMILANAGIFDGIRKYIAENREEPYWIEHVFGFYLYTATALATVLALIYIFLSLIGISEHFFGPDFDIYFYLLSGVILTRQSYSIARGGLMGLGLEERSEPLHILRKFLFAIFGLSLAYIGYDVVGVLLGHILAGFIVSILSFSYLLGRIDFKVALSRIPSNFPKKELLSFNILSIILILLTASLYHVDVLLIRLVVGSDATGYYRAALVIAEFLWFVPNALQTVLLHSTSELWSKGQKNQITAIVSKITRYNFSFLLLLAIGLIALVDDFIPLYFGSGFESSILPLVLLLPGVLGFSLARPIFAVGQGKGELRILILATGAAAGMNLCLNLLLIPLYGISGAAVATSLSYGSMVIFHVIAARQIGFHPLNDIRFLRIGSVATVSAIVIFGVSSLINSSYLSLLIVPPLGFLVYVISAIKFGVISSDEVDDISQRLPEPFDEHFKTLSVLIQNQ